MVITVCSRCLVVFSSAGHSPTLDCTPHRRTVTDPVRTEADFFLAPTAMNPQHDIEAWMRHALALAERGRGAVEPNPMVGAVVLNAAGELVGEGWHQKF